MTNYFSHATSFCGAVWNPVRALLDDIHTVAWDHPGQVLDVQCLDVLRVGHEVDTHDLLTGDVEYEHHSDDASLSPCWSWRPVDECQTGGAGTFPPATSRGVDMGVRR